MEAPPGLSKKYFSFEFVFVVRNYFAKTVMVYFFSFEEEDAFWEHRLVAVNSVGGAVFADCHSAVLPFRRSSVSNVT